MHYFKRNIGDYHKKAGRLSMLEHGAYTLLLDACYDREEFPTMEEALDWCWARSDDEEAAVRFVLSKFFTLEDGRYVQNRVREEIEAYRAMAAKNKEIAEKREATKRTKREKESTKRANQDTDGSPDQHEPAPNHKPLTNNQEPINKETAAAAPPPHTHAHTHVREDDTAPPPDLPVSDQTTPQTRFAELLRSWELVRGKVCKASANDARLATWAERGISEAQLRAAYDLAVTDRINSGDNSAVNAGFVDTMLAKVLAASGSESALAKSGLAVGTKPWPCSWSGIVAKGEELGITQQDGEQAPAFKARVISAAGLSEIEKSALRTDWGVSL